MDDNIMYAWKVTDSSGDVRFTCARKEMATYLRDWCEADEYNSFVNVSKYFSFSSDPHIIQMMGNRLERFYVFETEVVL